MSFPMLGSLCRCTLKHILLKHLRCRQNVNKMASSLGVVRFFTTDGTSDSQSENRIPRAVKKLRQLRDSLLNSKADEIHGFPDNRDHRLAFTACEYADPNQTHQPSPHPFTTRIYRILDWQDWLGNYRSPWKVLAEEFQGIKAMKPAGTEVPRETDVLIIGGGIVGSSVAYWVKHLHPSATTVTIIERDPLYTRSSSMLSWEGVRHQFSDPENVQLSLFASEFLCNIKQHLAVAHESPPDVQFNHQGYLILAQEKDAEQLAENVAMQNELGARVVLLTKTQLTEKYPWMNFNGIDCGSLGLEGEGWLDPWALLRALKQKNISLGIKYVRGELISLDAQALVNPDDPMFRFESGLTRTPNGREYETKFSIVVNCAGPWAADVAELAMIGTGEGDLSVPLPVEPRKRYVYVTHCPDGPTLDCPFVIDPSGLFIRREGYGGHYICGRTPTSEVDEPPIANFDVDYNFYDESVLPLLTNRLPCFNKSNLKAAWAGYVDYNIIDQNMVIGSHSYLKNFLFANGLNSHGLQHSIGVGRGIAELVINKDYKTINLEKFHFDRFVTDGPIQEQITA